MKKIIISLFISFFIIILENIAYADAIEPPSAMETTVFLTMSLLYMIYPVLFITNISIFLLREISKTELNMKIAILITSIANILFPILMVFESEIYILFDLLILSIIPIFIYKKYETIAFTVSMVSMITNFTTFLLLNFLIH